MRRRMSVGMLFIGSLGATAILATAGVAAGGQARGGQSAALKACSLLSAADVKKLADVTNPMFDSIPPREESAGNSGSSCTYAGVTTQIDVIGLSSIDDLP